MYGNFVIIRNINVCKCNGNKIFGMVESIGVNVFFV